jgi:hypothetical protein
LIAFANTSPTLISTDLDPDELSPAGVLRSTVARVVAAGDIRFSFMPQIRGRRRKRSRKEGVEKMSFHAIYGRSSYTILQYELLVKGKLVISFLREERREGRREAERKGHSPLSSPLVPSFITYITTSLIISPFPPLSSPLSPSPPSHPPFITSLVSSPPSLSLKT